MKKQASKYNRHSSASTAASASSRRACTPASELNEEDEEDGEEEEEAASPNSKSNRANARKTRRNINFDEVSEQLSEEDVLTGEGDEATEEEADFITREEHLLIVSSPPHERST